MSYQQLQTTDQQRDLAIMITKDLKRHKQTEKSYKTAKRVVRSLPVISGTNTKNCSSHYTNFKSAHISNMQCNSAYHL